MGGADETGAPFSGWSWEENKLFEVALAMVDEGSPDRWKAVASMVGGGKTAEEVEKHYKVLLEDLDSIESGRLDHELSQELDRTQAAIWTAEDEKAICWNIWKKKNRRHYRKEAPIAKPIISLIYNGIDS